MLPNLLLLVSLSVTLLVNYNVCSVSWEHINNLSKQWITYRQFWETINNMAQLNWCRLFSHPVLCRQSCTTILLTDICGTRCLSIHVIYHQCILPPGVFSPDEFYLQRLYLRQFVFVLLFLFESFAIGQFEKCNHKYQRTFSKKVGGKMHQQQDHEWD